MKDKITETDQLIARCLNGEGAAYRQLYEQYCKALYSTSVRMLGNTQDAEDALQEAYVNIFNNLKKFDARVTFGAWAKRITINVCLNKLRKKKLRWIELDFDLAESDDQETMPEISAELLHEVIEKLPSGCKAVFVLKAFEEYRHEDIAKELKISLSTSKSQFVRAKKLLIYSLKKRIRI